MGNEAMLRHDIPRESMDLEELKQRKRIIAYNEQRTDDEVEELVAYLLDNPDAVTCVDLCHNLLTDKVGVKLAQFVSLTTTLCELDLSHNRFTDVTYYAMAAALRVNKSPMTTMHLHGNQLTNIKQVHNAFVDALRFNSYRSECSWWTLDIDYNTFDALMDCAEHIGHPTLQEMLCQDREISARKRNLK